METAKIVQDEEGQAVHLPKAYAFTGDRVYIKRIGGAIVLLPYDNPYSVLLESLDEFTADFMAERAQPAQTQRDNPFA
jgi:antitoxin VapB